MNCRLSLKINTLMLLFVSITFCSVVYARDEVDTEQLKEMSLEELFNVQIDVSAAIKSLIFPEIPTSITIIDAEETLNTSARNIMDLMEIYVPGFFWMNDEEGPKVL